MICIHDHILYTAHTHTPDTFITYMLKTYATHHIQYVSTYVQANAVDFGILDICSCHTFVHSHTQDASKNDSYCWVCHDGGDVLCCDRCPRVFHVQCSGLVKAPEGDEEWFCPVCKVTFSVESSQCSSLIK